MSNESRDTLSTRYERVKRAPAIRCAIRANLQRAFDFIARANEFDAAVNIDDACNGFGTNALVLWFSATPRSLPTAISIAGVITSDVAAVQDAVRIHNDHRTELLSRLRPAAERAA